uniref:alpha-(1,3)-fucosyltransferase 6-like isoform X1 n=1 Tax=Ciona intestinalis TaxID=7719 RepID=UPI000180CC89|nr:alpha-(1,3)-fucosyltransferase 6-like isoform X1 [Ciona intestinalis]|eukprot:XP_002121315.1 alpha-(1,3)-fucosyltransferase 6-like isoform X1 [Ciona intestinalis]
MSYISAFLVEKMRSRICRGVSLLSLAMVFILFCLQSHYYEATKTNIKAIWKSRAANILSMSNGSVAMNSGSHIEIYPYPKPEDVKNVKTEDMALKTTTMSTTTTTTTATTTTTTTNTAPPTQQSTTQDPSLKKPIILDWVSTYHKRNWHLPATKACGGGCELTTDHNRLDESDAVIFYMKGTDAKNKPDPTKRKPHQVFAWWCHESPSTVRHYWHKALTEHNNFFNVTMHFRSDSDIISAMIPHTALDWYLHRVGRGKDSFVAELPRVTDDAQFENMFQELLKVKKLGSAWVASDCAIVKHARERHEFVKRIKNEGKYPVEMYGKCGDKELPLSNTKFFDFLRTFKFYFAFENTLDCKDYLTEKFWYNGLYAGLVPVVWGTSKETAERIAPPGSYIHAADFGNDPVRLADHLRMLESNDTAYKEYFQWWKQPGFYPVYKIREPENPEDLVQDDMFDYEVNGYCHMCKLIRQGWNKNHSQTVPNLNQNFFGPESSTCLA